MIIIIKKSKKKIETKIFSDDKYHNKMSVADLICPMCGTESTDETQELFVAECNCCHRDFCEKCVEIIQKNIDNKCNSCNDECETKCHDGCECECSDVESESDDESESEDE